MPLDSINQYRATIGHFYNIFWCYCSLTDIHWTLYLVKFVFFNFLLPHLIYQCGDVSKNSGPNNTFVKKLSFAHVNVFSLTANSIDKGSNITYPKIDELSHLARTNDLDIICDRN